MTTYFVEHKRHDGGDEGEEPYEFSASYPTAVERDEHARILREEDRGAFDIKTYEL